MKRTYLTELLGITGVREILSRVGPWSGVLGFNYHRIGCGSGSVFDRGLWSADEEAFDFQVRYLKSQADVISPADLPEVMRSKRGRYVLITFDDGYVDNYTAALPILKRNGVQATFFVATGFIDNPHLPWWDEIAWIVRSSKLDRLVLAPWIKDPVVLEEPDREKAVRTILRAFKAMPSRSTEPFVDDLAAAAGTGRFTAGDAPLVWLTWPMLREMRDAGMTIGGHTVTHPVLSQMSASQQWEEIDTCGKRLAAELGEPMRYFSYPVGGRDSFNQDTRDCLRRAGVRYAFSYYGGLCRFSHQDDFDIPRTIIEPYVDGSWFRSIVSLPRYFA